MVDLKVLKELGITAEAWRSLLEIPSRDDAGSGASLEGGPTLNSMLSHEEPSSRTDKLTRLRNRIRMRVNAGRDYNLSNWQHYHNLDLLWDAVFNQVSPTMVGSIIDKFDTSEKAYNVLNAMKSGLGDLMTKSVQRDPKTGQTRITLEAPAFFHVTVPLIRAYITIRKAKLINDRNLRPLFKFQSPTNTPENRVKAEIVTDIIDNTAKEFAYLETADQALHQMLLYQYCIIFPRECWYAEEQLHYKRPGNPMSNGQPDLEDYAPEHHKAVNSMNKVVTKQGIRYYIPHPTRTYYDQAFSQKTLNNDMGCMWAGHWRVVRFKELRKSEGFYNLDKIHIGNTEWWNSCLTFWNSVMSRCQISFPDIRAAKVPENANRDEWLAQNLYYQADYDDSSVIVYEHFEKLIPKDDGLGDYPYPIWARFVVAGDGTIIYATPVGYCPPVTFIDNGDVNKTEEASMAMILQPYQDQVTNMLSQYLLTVKQNLANLTLIDQNVVSSEAIDRIKNIGEAFYRRLNVFMFDSKALHKGQYGVPQAIFSHRFQYLDTNGILQAIRTVLDLAERVLQFSNQEVAQAASHEQTKHEVEVIANTTSNILTYTGRCLDNGLEAMARQNYYALMNYGEDDFVASIPSDHKLTKEKLQEIGITLVSEFKRRGDPLERMEVVGNKKTAMRLDTFAVTTGLYERQIDVQAAQAMAVFLRDLTNSPITGPAIGPDQAIYFANEVARLAGLPLPRPLTNTGMTVQKQQEQAKEMINSVIAEVMKMVKEGNQPILEAIKTNELMIGNLYQALRIPIPNVAGEQDSGRAPQTSGAGMVATS